MINEIDYDVRKNDYDLYCYKSESWSLSIEVRNEDESLKDLSLYTAKMQIRDDESGVLIKDLDGLVLGTSGIMQFSLSYQDTDSMYFINARYDIFITNTSNGERIPLLKGKFIIVPNITKTA